MHKGAMIEKELIAATSRAFVLSILKEGDSYGYSIIQRVGELTEYEFKWTDSMLYPVLHRLEKAGSTRSYWQSSPTGRKRKYYAITETGEAELQDKQRQWSIAQRAFGSLWNLTN
jgi:DNA-binding PadR family transcriptional regulator